MIVTPRHKRCLKFVGVFGLLVAFFVLMFLMTPVDAVIAK